MRINSNTIAYCEPNAFPCENWFGGSGLFVNLILKFYFSVKPLAIDSSKTEVKLPKDESENKEPKIIIL